MSFPSAGTYPVYFEKYIQLVPQQNLSEAIAAQQDLADYFFQSVPEQKHHYAYAPGKWTLKEMLLHIIDTERIFCFRALCFARGEQQNIPGFEEDDYVAQSEAGNRSWQSLCEEWQSVRKATVTLLNSFSEKQLQQRGRANEKEVTVLALGYMILGHVYHHVQVAKERYGL